MEAKDECESSDDEECVDNGADSVDSRPVAGYGSSDFCQVWGVVGCPVARKPAWRTGVQIRQKEAIGLVSPWQPFVLFVIPLGQRRGATRIIGNWHPADLRNYWKGPTPKAYDLRKCERLHLRYANIQPHKRPKKHHRHHQPCQAETPSEPGAEPVEHAGIVTVWRVDADGRGVCLSPCSGHAVTDTIRAY